MLMIDNNLNNDSQELINKIKKELPNIVLPAMGIFEEIKKIDIDGKDFLKKSENEEEEEWS